MRKLTASFFMFENGAEPTGLVLASSKHLASGVLDLTYTADAQ